MQMETANSGDPDQTAPLELYCLPRSICPKIKDHYSITIISAPLLENLNFALVKTKAQISNPTADQCLCFLLLIGTILPVFSSPNLNPLATFFFLFRPLSVGPHPVSYRFSCDVAHII